MGSCPGGDVALPADEDPKRRAADGDQQTNETAHPLQILARLMLTTYPASPPQITFSARAKYGVQDRLYTLTTLGHCFTATSQTHTHAHTHKASCLSLRCSSVSGAGVCAGAVAGAVFFFKRRLGSTSNVFLLFTIHFWGLQNPDTS